MKRTLITSLLASALLFGGGCSDDFDGLRPVERGRRDIQPNSRNSKNRPINSTTRSGCSRPIVNGGAITSITQDAEGNDVIRFKGADNIEHSVTVATKDDVSSAPILGTKEENGVLYWTTTVDGKHRFSERHRRLENPRCGAYSRNGRRQRGLLDPQRPSIDRCVGKPGESRRKAGTSLITGISRDDNGNAIFTLGDGSTVSAPIFGRLQQSSSRSATPPSTTSTPSKTFRSHSRSVTRSRAKRPTKRS